VTTLELMSSRPARANVEVLVLAAARIDGAPSLLTDGIITEDLDVGALATALSAVGFTGELDEVARVPSGALGPDMTADCVLVVGTGTDPGPGDATALGATRAGSLKRAAGCAARTLSGSGSAAFLTKTAYVIVAAALIVTVVTGLDYVREAMRLSRQSGRSGQ